MTSIEWLIEQIKEYDFTPPSNNEEYVIVMPKWIFDAKRDEALVMHKQEIIDAWKDGYGGDEHSAEEYYQETFVSKGSHDHISDISKMVDVPKQEITDGEIQSTAETFWTEPNESDIKRGWKLGAKWMREQLKKKI